MPGDDREWIAAQGASRFYLSYRAIGTGDQIIVNQGQVISGQPTTAATYDAINPAQTGIYLGTEADNEIGNIAVDPSTGNVYQVFVGSPPSPTAVESCSVFNTAYMAVGVPSTTGGVTTLTFTDYVIHQSPDPSANSAPAAAVTGALAATLGASGPAAPSPAAACRLAWPGPRIPLLRVGWPTPCAPGGCPALTARRWIPA